MNPWFQFDPSVQAPMNSIESYGLEDDGISIDQLNADDGDTREDLSLYDSLEMEPLPTEPSRLNTKREVQPLFELIFGVLDTMHAATKNTVRRARERNIQRIL